MKMPYVKFYVSLVIESLITQTFLRLASFIFFQFFSTALKDFQGILSPMDPDGQKGSRVDGRQEKLCLGCILETVRCNWF